MRPAEVIEQRLAEAADQFCVAEVSDVDGFRVEVSIVGSDPLLIARLDTWTPAAGDVVLIAKTPAGWVALGKIAS